MTVQAIIRTELIQQPFFLKYILTCFWAPAVIRPIVYLSILFRHRTLRLKPGAPLPCYRLQLLAQARGYHLTIYPVALPDR